MFKAILQKGEIVPLEPLPLEWTDGTVLQIAKSAAVDLDIDAWANEMDQLCADSSDEGEELMRRAIDEHRQQAKVQARREMGLPV